MKKTIILLTIFSFVSGGVIFLHSKVEAYDSTAPVHNIFVDTLYGMATGLVLAAAFTAAKGEGHGDEWGGNLGAGAAVGGLLGAAYGFFLEYKGVAEITNSRICFHLPTPTISLNPHSADMTIRTDLLLVHF